jgi:hypothetical protein
MLYRIAQEHWSNVMQISRHWRLNSKRYRLEGVRYENGDVSLQQRPTVISTDNTETQMAEVVVENNDKAFVAA